MNAPIVSLRDKVLAGNMTREEFINAVDRIAKLNFYRDSQQVKHLLLHPPSEEVLASAKGRAELGDQLDRLNSLSKVVSRTLKREVMEGRVKREAHVIKAKMTDVELAFYTAVTEKIREYCYELDASEGFMLTIPQRQISSSMAAACDGWMSKVDDLDEASEVLYELGLAEEIEGAAPVKKNPTNKGMGDLITQLVRISREVGNVQQLRLNDTKYSQLLTNLRRYWRTNPSKKVVLFAFYKNTLRYLAERLKEDGVDSVVLHGGMDKQQALKAFEEPNGPKILLSSEVASEGVDLQFSSLLINYDLPWNPSKIEQRIGRIDRIGQESPKILIWNMIYEGTVDDRVYSRLLERLNIFERSLGSMEVVLGDEIRSLSYKLLSHQLTPEQEQERIDKSRVAIENVSRINEQLEAEASSLIAHGDFIQNKVKAAQELGRYIRGEDLYVYAKDFFAGAYPGTRFLADPKKPDLFKLDFSTEARIDFTEFLQKYNLQGKTTLLSTSPAGLIFENKHGKNIFGIERVTQEHPLIRFVSAQLVDKGSSSTYFPVTACKVHVDNPKIPSGTYVYAVARWTLSGSRDVERLEYAAHRMGEAEALDNDLAEWLVNMAALDGQDWIGVQGEVDLEVAARLQDECRANLEESFYQYRDTYAREDADRIQDMVRFLESHLERKRTSLLERIAVISSLEDVKRKRILPALKGQLKSEEIRIEQRLADIRLRERLKSKDSLVSSGLILVC